MARTKLKRLSKIKELPNIFSFGDPNINNTLQAYLKFSNLFTVEIGCGHGDYSIELAKKFPERNFLGVDVKGARIFNGATQALELKLINVAFIISKAEKLNDILPEKSIEEIYIPFPDPHVRRANHSRRLISPLLLKVYKGLLIDSGKVHFKTDNKVLYEYALKTIAVFGCSIQKATDNLYEKSDPKFASNILTTFEKHYLKEGRKIKYICFRF